MSESSMINIPISKSVSVIAMSDLTIRTSANKVEDMTTSECECHERSNDEQE